MDENTLYDVFSGLNVQDPYKIMLSSTEFDSSYNKNYYFVIRVKIICKNDKKDIFFRIKEIIIIRII